MEKRSKSVPEPGRMLKSTPQMLQIDDSLGGLDLGWFGLPELVCLTNFELECFEAGGNFRVHSGFQAVRLSHTWHTSCTFLS